MSGAVTAVLAGMAGLRSCRQSEVPFVENGPDQALLLAGIPDRLAHRVDVARQRRSETIRPSQTAGSRSSRVTT